LTEIFYSYLKNDKHNISRSVMGEQPKWKIKMQFHVFYLVTKYHSAYVPHHFFKSKKESQNRHTSKFRMARDTKTAPTSTVTAAASAAAAATTTIPTSVTWWWPSASMGELHLQQEKIRHSEESFHLTRQKLVQSLTLNRQPSKL